MRLEMSIIYMSIKCHLYLSDLLIKHESFFFFVVCFLVCPRVELLLFAAPSTLEINCLSLCEGLGIAERRD